ncbi:MAG: thioredoxin family protein [Phycisphaerales bacterium]|nr:thioredoxin family protein [Phycisphaerales bacterium]
MKQSLRRILPVCLVLAIGVIAMSAFAGDEPKKDESAKRSDIYDRHADGEKQIADALVEAKRDHKRVLLQFGANWCGWCHKLHNLCKADKDIAHELLYEYIVVAIDVDKVDGEPHNAKVVRKYDNPTKHGLPVLVILDEDGKHLHTQDTGKLEEGDHHDPAKVLEVLRKWKASPPTADDELAAGLAKAKAEHKAVFVDFSAPWCGWCHRLDAYLRRPEIAKVFDSAFVSVKVDVDRFKGGKELNARYGGDKAGLPFFVFVDSDGKKIGDSIASPGGNVGFPVKEEEVAHFIAMVRKASPTLTDAQVKVLSDGLKTKEPAAED